MNRPRFTIYQDTAGGWRWKLQSRNGRVIADSGEAYTERRHAVRAVAALRKAVAVAGVRHAT